MAYFRPLLFEHGLNDVQWRVLRVVESNGEVTFSEIANQAVVLKASLSRIVRDLETRGYITRHSVDSDQRQFTVRLTQGGQQLVGGLAPHIETAYDRISRTVTPERISQLIDLLHELIELTQNDRGVAARNEVTNNEGAKR